MGLDMYLYGVKQEFEKHDYNIGGYKESTEIGYWRKANAIHRWFVENCQDGEDNCATYVVGHEDLKELKRICEKVLQKPQEAEDLLPTQSGFFFGPTEYDEWYIQDLKDTIEIIDWALAQDFDYFEYHSSW
jgi:hypothetical protein